MSDTQKNGDSFVYTRAHPRAPVRLRVRVKPENGHSRSYHTKNLSAGGVFVLSDAPLEEETRVTLELFLPRADQPVKLRGEVVWKQRQAPSGFAVKFTGTTEAERNLIRLLIPPAGDH